MSTPSHVSAIDTLRAEMDARFLDLDDKFNQIMMALSLKPAVPATATPEFTTPRREPVPVISTAATSSDVSVPSQVPLSPLVSNYPVVSAIPLPRAVSAPSLPQSYSFWDATYSCATGVVYLLASVASVVVPWISLRAVVADLPPCGVG